MALAPACARDGLAQEEAGASHDHGEEHPGEDDPDGQLDAAHRVERRERDPVSQDGGAADEAGSQEQSATSVWAGAIKNVRL